MSMMNFRGCRLISPRRIFVEGQKAPVYMNKNKKRFVHTSELNRVNLNDIERYGSWVDITENLVCAYHEEKNKSMYRRTSRIQYPHDSNALI